MSIEKLIGNTPLIKINNLNLNKKVELFAKLESKNPGGSVKDRAAYYMIKGAESRGELKPGIKLIEPTSGNTGIALAMMANLKGYKIVLVMPQGSTKERIQTMKAYGAKVILTPKKHSMEGAIDYTKKKVAKGGYIMLNQFANDDNPKAHYEGTGPEIWRQTKGKITHFVSAMGTTGTIMGVSRFLKGKKKNIQIIGAEPKENSCIPGIRKWPKEYLPAIFDAKRVDKKISVSEKEAVKTTRDLAKKEGIFCGMSGGGAVFASLKVASKLKKGFIVTIIPDLGDRYLSSDLFR